jgi:hypothetical protein
MTTSTGLDGVVGEMLSGAPPMRAAPTPPAPRITAAAAPRFAAKKKAASRKAAVTKTASAKIPAKKAAGKRTVAKKVAAGKPAASQQPQATAPALADADTAPLSVPELERTDDEGDTAGADSSFDDAILAADPVDATDREPEFDDDDADQPDVDEDARASAPGELEQTVPLFIPTVAPACEREPFVPPVPGRTRGVEERDPWRIAEASTAPEPPQAVPSPAPAPAAARPRAMRLPFSPLRLSRVRTAVLAAAGFIAIGLLIGSPSKPATTVTAAATRTPTATAKQTATPAAKRRAETRIATSTPARRSSSRPRSSGSTSPQRRSSARTRARVKVKTRVVYVPRPVAASPAPRTTTTAPAAPLRASAFASAGPSGFSSEFRP